MCLYKLSRQNALFKIPTSVPKVGLAKRDMKALGWSLGPDRKADSRQTTMAFVGVGHVRARTKRTK